MKYRGKGEIIASILGCVEVNNGAIKTKIMYYSFLSYQQLLYYLEYLITNELLTHNQSNNMYNITGKGLKFIELQNKLTNLLKISDATAIPHIKWI